MTPKTRVKACLEKQPTDRIPVFMWFHPETAILLGQQLEIPAAFVGDAMGNDIKQTWINNNYAMEGIVHEQNGESHTDFWGIKWTKEGAFNQISYSPLENSNESQISDYEFPYKMTGKLLEQMQPVIEHKKDFFIGCDVSPCVFEMYNRLRGMENAMLDLAAAPHMAEKLLARCADFGVHLSTEACEKLPLDWLWTGDDVASQQSLFMHPDTWRALIKPHLKRVMDVGKKNNLWVAYHCCGALYPIIPDLIEIGMDVLNPIQCNCPNMDAFELKKEFGNDIAFMGGVDTQYLLPNGTVTQVKKATEELLKNMTSDGGGYILAASHTIPPETPFENIFAMYETAGISREEIYDRAADIRKESTSK